jgi:restriction endonuclease S subunit
MSLPAGWTKYEFGEIASPSSKRCNPATVEEELRCVELEHVSQGDGRLLGTVDVREQRSIKAVFNKGDVLFGKLRPNLRKAYLCEFSGACSTEIWVLQPRSTVCRSEYLVQIVQSHRFVEAACVTAGSKMPRAEWDYVSATPFQLPPIEEQEKIAAVLSSWDRGIWKLSDLIATKLRSREGLVQRLLSGSLRFQEYSKRAHEHVPLNSVLAKVSDSVIPSASEMYREIGVRSHGKGIFHKEPVSGDSLGNKRVYRVVPGCLTVNIVFAWERAVAITTEREAGMIASHRFPMFRPSPDRLLAEYVLLYLLSKKGSEALELASPGGAGRNRTLSQTGFLKNLIPLPSVAEQRRVVTFVQTADREIDLLRKQLEALKQQKKGLMQKLLTGEVRVKI